MSHAIEAQTDFGMCLARAGERARAPEAENGGGVGPRDGAVLGVLAEAGSADDQGDDAPLSAAAAPGRHHGLWPPAPRTSSVVGWFNSPCMPAA